jgi:hypothetical protein
MFKAWAGLYLFHQFTAGGNAALLALVSGLVEANLDKLATGSAKTTACPPKMRDATQSARVTRAREQVVLAIGRPVSARSRNLQLASKPMHLGLARSRRSGSSWAMPGACGTQPSRHGMAVPFRTPSPTRATAQNFGAGTSSTD